MYLHNVVQLRAEKSERSSSLSSSVAANATSLTFLPNVPTSVIDDCCTALGYFVRLMYGVDERECRDQQLTGDEANVFALFNGASNFCEYVTVCRRIVESVLQNVKFIYDLHNGQTSENDSSSGELKSMYEMLRHMDSLFQQFYAIFTDEESFPRRTIRDKLFVSACLSERRPIVLRREHISDRETLFAALICATDAMSDQSNTVFEAFFCGGFFVICLLNILTTNYTSGAQQAFTRVRMLGEGGRESIPLLKNTLARDYQESIQNLPAALFDPETDVYLSKSDTLTTLFAQFLGRVFLRMYEWCERSDVNAHVRKHFLPANTNSLFSIVGRGPDQKAWIRFFKRASNGAPKVFVKIEPLLQLNDQLIVNSSANKGNTMTSNASADVVQRYQMLKDFLSRYNDFCARNNNQAYWRSQVERFDRVLNDPTIEMDSPLRSFDVWCADVNSIVFPYNFLLMFSSIGTQELDECWVYRAQQYLMNRRFTSGKCGQLLQFLRTVEIKSRLFFDEQQFMFLFTSAMKSMPFLYDLFNGETNECLD